MPERPRPDLNRVREALEKRDEDVPEEPQEPQEEEQDTEDDGDT